MSECRASPERLQMKQFNIKGLAMETRNTNTAFNDAIKSGVLSDGTNGHANGLNNYAGNYMYMFSTEGTDFFKNIVTREYVKSAYC